MTTLVLVTDEKEIIEFQDNLENVLKSQLNQEQEFSFGFQSSNFRKTANYNGDIWYATSLIENEGKVPRFWNGFGLCENLNKNKSNNISVEINIPKTIYRNVVGAFARNEDNKIVLIHRGRLNPGGSKFLDWYRENFPECVKTIADEGKGKEVIIVGTLSDSDFIGKLSAFIRNVISFKNWFRSGDMSDSNIQDVEIDSEVGSEAGINYRHLFDTREETLDNNTQKILCMFCKTRVATEQVKRWDTWLMKQWFEPACSVCAPHNQQTWVT
ncbi:MAG: hypothetical protein WCL34_14495 [Methylococcaceae bacterium]